MIALSKPVAPMVVIISVTCLACGSPGAQAPQEVLAARGCQDNNPFSCKVLAVEKVPQPYRDAGTGQETEAWCLVFQAGNLPPKSSLVYLSTTTEGKTWVPDFGGKTKFEKLGCVQAAQLAPER